MSAAAGGHKGRLEGKIALVTGAASGIGAATVELMLREGARLDPPIRVNAVHPGYIRTGMTNTIAETLGAERFERRVENTVPLRRLGEPGDIAEAIVFLASDQSRFATGASLVIDGGWIAQ